MAPKVGGFQSQDYMGEVLDVKHSEQGFFYKIKAYGKHDDWDEESCPWIPCAMPVTSAGLGGVGQTPGLLKGSKVMIKSLDGSEGQQLIITHSITPIRDKNGDTKGNNFSPLAQAPSQGNTVDGKQAAPLGGDKNHALDDSVKDVYANLIKTASSFS